MLVAGRGARSLSAPVPVAMLVLDIPATLRDTAYRRQQFLGRCALAEVAARAERHRARPAYRGLRRACSAPGSAPTGPPSASCAATRGRQCPAVQIEQHKVRAILPQPQQRVRVRRGLGNLPLSDTEVSRLRRPVRTIAWSSTRRILIPAAPRFCGCGESAHGSRATSVSPLPSGPADRERTGHRHHALTHADQAKPGGVAPDMRSADMPMPSSATSTRIPAASSGAMAIATCFGRPCRIALLVAS